MRTDIHPAYGDINVSCSCGHHFTTSSTLGKDLHVEVCYKCHPFYSGEQRLVDTGGRVQRFAERYKRLKTSRQQTQP